ncbi:4'-phosphopantetheinyl transferase superfamily protein [Streptomyces sp. NPDC020096]
MIEELLPAPVAARELFGEPPEGAGALLPQEEAVLVRSVAKRRREFAGTRSCARRALAVLGVPPTPILPGERGAPRWPTGIVGSMTHRQGYCAAAVAYGTDLLAIGIDAEPDEPLPRQVRDTVVLSAERGWAVPGAAGPDSGVAVCRDRLLFSAKESVYKAWFPLTGRPLGFRDALVEPVAAGASGEFRVRLLVPAPMVGGRPLPSFTGYWLVRDGLILTAVTVPPV